MRVRLIILEILIALGILAVPLFWVQRIARAASTGNAMMAYREAGENIPRYRIWTGSWGDEKIDAVDVGGDVYWCALKSCPKRNEKILGVLDSNYDINVQVYSGGGWGNKQEVTAAAGTNTRRAFDIAYEQSSGDAIVVFSVNSNEAHYSPWNGSAWGSGGNCVAVGTGDIEWIALASKPGADEIIMATQDTNYEIYAQIWDGSNWGNEVKLGLSDVLYTQSFDVAYEQSSGRAMVVYVDMNLTDYIPYYSIWDGSSGAAGEWVSGGEAASRGGYDLRWVRLASKPGTREIMLGTVDDNQDIHAEIWYSGNTEEWSSYTGDLTQDCVLLTERVMDVAYESSSGEGIIVYRDNNLDTLKYSIWDGSNWQAGGDTSSPTAGALPHWVKLASHPDTDEIMLLGCYAIDGVQYDDEYNVQKWNGSVWGTISAAETAGYSKYESFAIDYDRHSPQVSIIIRKWRELYR